MPFVDSPTVQLAHGGGGRQSQRLIEGLLVPAFDDPRLRLLHDGALLELGGARLAFSTDTFVVHPHFFPGGDIGTLAVHGTVNDVAMCGARPVALSLAFVLEEGFPVADLERIVASIAHASRAAGVGVVTGDTKVVDRGKGDGIFVNTSGIGVVLEDADVSPLRVRPGDRILLSGPIADHGVAILSVREGLQFETTIESDTACLAPMAEAVVAATGRGTHVLRDPTRGGVASTLCEIAQAAGVGIELDEAAIPVREEVRGACEILGLDPLYVANEGKMIAIVAPEEADRALEAMRRAPHGSEAAAIGEVVDTHPSRVVLRGRIGGRRVVEMLSGEQLPRIC